MLHQNNTKSNYHVISSYYQAPIPSASEVEKYEKVLKNSFDRILKMSEEELQIRKREVEGKIIIAEKMSDNSTKISKYGTLNSLGIMFFLTLIAITAIIVYRNDASGVSSILASLPAVGYAFIFVIRWLNLHNKK